ncbi:helix-turn-helix domain-containing protein [Ramlibacter henchirensis]|uniref:Helix-turn-helix domain-containing protein n=1 Tax=Ramlibacter henchirensis TaxID=204072 RepID=A0A4Z0C7X1_9BURK|nr:helix-turn-helix domain-containing protein [Ramlibacter henchirensis]TFZ06179.1 helix-turn-helix domain-containing protein [Ramlibacter henchirensis]
MPKARRSTVALLGTPAASAGTLYGFVDLLASTRRDWQILHGGAPAESPFEPLVVTRDGSPFTAMNGVVVTPDTSFERCTRPDIVCITDLMEEPGLHLAERYKPEIDWLLQAWNSGATLCSACSGAMLLASTGLLDGQEATSHWAYCDLLARDFPRTRWNPERMLVVTGQDRRLMMAGSGTAWYMLALALIARFASPQEAMQVARVNLLGSSDVSAIAYASLTRGARAADPVVERCQVWAALNYRSDSPVARLVAMSGLPERTFKRRFTEATGMSPLEYVHMLRLEESKQLLETTELPIEAIATEVGYQDASFFNRLFRRKVALSPSAYRRRFGPLSQQLRELATPSAEPAYC